MGPRIFASGHYTLPTGGPATWNLTKIVVEYRVAGGGGWYSFDATVDTTNKTWQYATTIQASGNYEVRARLHVVKVTGGMPPVHQNLTYDLDAANVTVP
jgi:hypothetical protein